MFVNDFVNPDFNFFYRSYLPKDLRKNNGVYEYQKFLSYNDDKPYNILYRSKEINIKRITKNQPINYKYNWRNKR